MEELKTKNLYQNRSVWGLTILFMCTGILSFAQSPPDSHPYLVEITAFQKEMNEQYGNPETTILKEKQLQAFKEAGGHSFFTVDSSYRFEASLEVFSEPERIRMSTNLWMKADFDIYGKASFSLAGNPVNLLIYKLVSLEEKEGSEDYLFLPFKDLTAGKETYGGGRYIDLKIPEDASSIIIDFNKAYNPYCAYSLKYVCPIPPKENLIEHEIRAGIKYVK
ncbi:MAG: DUF1684 domain-containing protein, partial [Bacteroidota bacterium]